MSSNQVPKLVGICGYARCGKNTIGDILSTHCGFEQRAFADKLRELAAACDPLIEIGESFDPGSENYGVLLEQFGYEFCKDSYPEVRRFLVALGKGVREVLGGDVWLDACLPAPWTPGWESGWILGPTVVTDVRYPNEARRIRDLGGEVWYIDRPKCGPANDEEDRTISDILDDDLCDQLICNDGTLGDLKRSVSSALG
jgi:hypothetical protein